MYFGTESPVEIDLVERIEVIRGPGSSLYGNGALFGVVNVITRQGRALRGAELAGAVQSYGGRQARASFGTRFRSGLGVMASGSLYRSAGQDLYFPEYDDPATNFGRAVNLDRDRREHGFVKLSQGPLTLVPAEQTDSDWKFQEHLQRSGRANYRSVPREWRLTLSGYQYRINNLITNTIDPADSVSIFRNTGRVNPRHAEVEITGELTGLAVRASYGLQRAEDPIGATLGNSPRHLLKIGAWRALFRERLTLGAELNALSQRIAANGSQVPGHAVVNLTLRTQNWPLGLSAGLSVYNLFDQAYGDPVSEDHLQAAIPQDRCNFRATVRYAF